MRPRFERQQAVVEQRSGDTAEDAFEVAAEALVKVGQREAFAQPQIQEHKLTLCGGLVDRFGAGLRSLRALRSRRYNAPAAAHSTIACPPRPSPA